MLATVKDDSSGSIGIPAEMRDRLGVRIGEMVEVDYKNGHVVIRRPASIKDRISAAKNMVRATTKADTSSWSDEIIADHRADNAREGNS